VEASPSERYADVPARATGDFRQRLLDGLVGSIAQDGYRNTTVAGIVRRARTSRRTFYEHFNDKEACFVALLTETNAELIQGISAAVDPKSPWQSQIRQAVEAWIGWAEANPAIMLSWVRDVPALGTAARQLQRDVLEAFVAMVQTLCDTEEWHAIGPVPRPRAVMLLGGLRELIATTVEDGGQASDTTEMAVSASIALLGPRSA
jgi:AcrR family transcriptional regulator